MANRSKTKMCHSGPKNGATEKQRRSSGMFGNSDARWYRVSYYETDVRGFLTGRILWADVK